MTTPLGRGLYDFKEAATLTGLRISRIREWFRSHPSRSGRPLFISDYESVEGRYAISFYDLIDVFVAGQLREHKVSLQTVRKVYARMQVTLETEHPFCHEELLTDGKIVFMRNIDGEGKQQLKEVLTDQGVFADVVEPFLKQIDYDKVKLLARRWRIAASIVIDPQICFGAPIVEAVSIPSAILAAAYEANGQDLATVARWYNVSPEDVIAAVNFQQKLAA